MRNDGVVLIRWPQSDRSTNLSGTDLFSRYLKHSSVGYYKIISPFDGIAKYLGYEETPHYPMVVIVAMSEDWLLSDWWQTLRTDAIVAGVLLCMIVLLATLLSSAAPLPHEDRACVARTARPITACWPTTSPTSSS